VDEREREGEREREIKNLKSNPDKPQSTKEGDETRESRPTEKEVPEKEANGRTDEAEKESGESSGKRGIGGKRLHCQIE
jgi:hypothetical protein